MTEMTIHLPFELTEKLRPYQNRIPELLERGMRVLITEEGNSTAEDEATIMALLASNPDSEDVLRLRPSPALQTRASHLLAESKTGTLSRRGEAELERIMTLERLVRLAKANAHEQIANQPQQDHKASTMQFAGTWADMPDDQFQLFLDDIAKRRGNAFSGRISRETMFD